MRLPKGVGAEIQRTRPCVVINSTVFDPLGIRLIVPLTTWKNEFDRRFNKIQVSKDPSNGLDADSAADFLQIRSVALDRLITRIGVLNADLLEEIVAGVVIAIDYQP